MSHLFWSFVIFSVVLVNGNKVFVNIPAEYVTELAAASLDCVQKTGVQPDVLQHLIDWNFEDSDKLRKFLYCFGTTSGYADSNGHFKTEMMAKLIGNNRRKNQYTNTLDECNKTVGKDMYETFYKTVVCFHDKTPILFKL